METAPSSIPKMISPTDAENDARRRAPGPAAAVLPSMG